MSQTVNVERSTLCRRNPTEPVLANTEPAATLVPAATSDGEPGAWNWQRLTCRLLITPELVLAERCSSFSPVQLSVVPLNDTSAIVLSP